MFGGWGTESAPPPPKEMGPPLWAEQHFIRRVGLPSAKNDEEDDQPHEEPSGEMAKNAVMMVGLLKEVSAKFGTISRTGSLVTRVAQSLARAAEQDKEYPTSKHKEGDGGGGGGGGGSSGGQSDEAKEFAVDSILNLMTRLKGLKSDDFEVILSGGDNNKNTSAIIIVQRVSKGLTGRSFTLTIINRNQENPGQSTLDYHPYFLDDNLQVLRRTALTFADIPESKLLDEAVLYELLKEMNLAGTASGFNLIYEVVLPHLVGTNLSGCKEMQEKLNQSGDAPPEFEPNPLPKKEEPSQRRWNTVEQGVVFMLRAGGATPEQVGEVLLELDLVGANQLSRDMVSRASEFEQSSSVIVLEYLKRFAGRMKMGFRNCYTGPKIQAANVLLDNIFKQTDKMMLRVEGDAPPVLTLAKDGMTQCRPWTLFGMCQRAQSDEHAGPVMETGAGSFVDLQLTLPEEAKSGGPETEITELIHACAVKCMHLESRGAVIGYKKMMHRMAAIVEHCFLEQLTTLPKPPGDPTMLEDVPHAGLQKDSKVKIVKRGGATVDVQSESGDTHTVPASAVGDNPNTCVYRRLWMGKHQTMQQRMLTDLHTIARHYTMAILVEPRDGIEGLQARTATTAMTILCVLDAALRARSPKPMFIADILRGNVLEEPKSHSCVPLGLSTSTLSGVDINLLASNLESCSPEVLRARPRLLEYFQVVEELAKPPQDFAEEQPQPALQEPWLLFAWTPDKEFNENEDKAVFYPSCNMPKLDIDEIRPPNVKVPVHVKNDKRDDITLRMYQACVCQYMPNAKDAKPDMPKYLKDSMGDDYGAEVGPAMGPGAEGRPQREERDESAQEWAFHKWKQAPEVHVVAEVVWLFRAIMEDCLIGKASDSKEGLAAKDDRIKKARSPSMIEPKWVPVIDNGEPSRLALSIWNVTASEAEQGKSCGLTLPDESCITKGAISVFETLVEGVIGEGDKLEEPPQKSGDANDGEAADADMDVKKPPKVRLLSRPKPLNELDVLNCEPDQLETFEATLSLEESEYVHCILTAPRLCIPLLISFFAQERVGLLLQDRLLQVFHRVMFEPGEFMTPQATATVFDQGSKGGFLAPFQKPEKPKKGTQADEDKLLWGRYTDYYKTRASLGTEYGRFVEELQGPAAKEVLANWNLLAYGASSLAMDSFRAPAIKLVLYFCRVGCELARLCEAFPRMREVCQKEYGELVEWLGKICLQHLQTYIAKVEADPDLDAGERTDLLKRFQQHLLLLSEWRVEQTKPPPFQGQKLAAGAKDTRTPEEKEAYQSYSALLYNLMLSGAWTSSQEANYSVESAMVRSRPRVLAWAEDKPQTLYQLLGQISRMALGSTFTSCLPPPQRAPKWTPTKIIAPTCQMTFESAHPMMGGITTVDAISFPGAPYIVITFDPLTEMDDNSSFQFFKDAACRDPVKAKFSGSAMSGSWPGIAGTESLHVLAETVYYRATTAVGSEAWGFKFSASAPVSEEGCKEMESFASEHQIAEDLDPLVYQLALTDMHNNVEKAKKHLIRSCAQLASKAKSMQEASSNGLFSDETGGIQVNLQTGDVFFNNKPPVPVPDELFNAPEFQAVLGNLRPQSTVVESSANRKWYQVAESTEGKQSTYMIRQWSAIDKCDLLGDDFSSPPAAKSSKTEETPWGSPEPLTKHTFALLTVQGWVGYPVLEGTEGNALKYLDSIYERLDKDFLENPNRDRGRVLDSILKIISWTHPKARSGGGGKSRPLKHLQKIIFRERRAKDPQYLMYIRPPDGSMGMFVHILSHPVLDTIEFFAILDAGRRGRRSLTCTSNFRLTLKRPDEVPGPGRKSDGGMPFFVGSPFSPLFAGGNQNKSPQAPSVIIERSLIAKNMELEDKLLQDKVELPAELLPIPPFASRGFEGEISRPESALVEIYCQSDLYGSIPQILLEAYQFWRRGPNTIMGYPKRFDEKQVQATPWWAGSAIIVNMDKKKDQGDAEGPLEVNTEMIRVPWRQLEDADGCAGLKVASKPLVLLNALDPPKDSLLESVARVIARIEQLSYVLIWSSTVSVSKPGEPRQISFIQLPRLGLSFEFKMVEGEPRLECVQRSGMYIKAKLAEESSLHNLGLVKEWWPYVLLESSSGRTDVLMANYRWQKIKFAGNPLSTRCMPMEDSTWTNNFKDKFFVYPVHTSGTYLAGSPSELLFLVYLHLIVREFNEAHQLVDFCFVDSSKEGDEPPFRSSINQWINEAKTDIGQAKVRVADYHSFSIRLHLAGRWNTTDYDSYLPPFKDYLDSVASGRVSPECNVPLRQELRWLSLFRDTCKAVSKTMPKELEDRERLLKAQESGSQFEVQLDRLALLKDGGKAIVGTFAKSFAFADDALKRLSRSPPSQPPYQLKAAKSSEGEARPEQVKLTWSQQDSREGEAKIIYWRISGTIEGEGLENARSRRKERIRKARVQMEARFKAAGLPPPKIRDEEQEDPSGTPGLPQALEVEFLGATEGPACEATVDLPLGKASYTFRVEAITSVGKGAPSDPVKYACELGEDADADVPATESYFDRPGRLAGEALPVGLMRFSDSAKKSELKGVEVLSLFDDLNSFEDDLNQFIVICRLLLENGLRLAIHERAEKKDDKKEKKGAGFSSKARKEGPGKNEVECLCGVIMKADTIACPRCNGINGKARQVIPAGGEQPMPLGKVTLSLSKKNLCMLMLRKAIFKKTAGRNTRMGIACETAMAALVPILNSDKAESVLALPALGETEKFIDAASGQGKEFLMELLKVARELAPAPPAEGDDAAKKKKDIEKVTKKPESDGSTHVAVASNGKAIDLQVSSTVVPRSLYSPAYRIDQELKALSDKPLLPLVEMLRYTGEEAHDGKKNSEPVPFDPRGLKGKLPAEGSAYLERLGKDIDLLSEARQSASGADSQVLKPPVLGRAVRGLLSQEPPMLVEGGQVAGASLAALASTKQTLIEALDGERARMDAGWSTLTAEFGFPNSFCPPRTLLSVLFSTQLTQDLKRLTKLNAGKVESLASALGLLMLRSCRIAQLDMCVSLIQDLHASFTSWLVRALRLASENSAYWNEVTASVRALPGGVQLIQKAQDTVDGFDSGEERAELEVVLPELVRAAGNVFNMMRVKRVHGKWEQRAFKCDLRSLLVEYHTGFLLRPRQFQISESLASCALSERSVVQQMIMGAGKSTVIGPLLGLMLADEHRLVMVICPEALLPMSRDCLTGILGSVLGRRVYNFSWLRQQLNSDEAVSQVSDQVVNIRLKMERAAQDQGCFITTPSYVKTFFLQYVCTMVDSHKADPALTLPGTELSAQGWGDNKKEVLKWYRDRERVSDEMARVLKFWRERCTVVIDEVDWVLHPLKSELNFPIGQMEALQPTPERYTMPMFLLEAPVAAAAGKLPSEAAKANDRTATIAADQVKQAITRGIKEFMVQRNPNLVIMSKDWYNSNLREPMGNWALVFLQRCLRADAELSKYSEKEGAGDGDGSPVGPKPTGMSTTSPSPGGDNTNFHEQQKQKQEEQQRCWAKWWGANTGTVLQYIGATGTPGEQQAASEAVATWPLTPHTVQVLNKCREWIKALLVHCLSKRDRIDYGLLIPIDEDKSKVKETTQATRQVMAVPFTGKDRPSQAAEFASPDVAIGLTYLAYQYEGLRKFSYYILATLMKEEMKKEPGPFNIRPHWKQFQDWIDEAKATNTKVEVLPLDLFQPGDADQLKQLQELLKDLPVVRTHYLAKHVFGKICYLDSSEKVRQIPGTQAMMTRLSSSSMDLGGEMLFKVRIGFTGTPSEVLPRTFADKNGNRCVYEEKSDAEIICTLTSRECVSVQVVKQGHPAGESGQGPAVVWSVESLLRYISQQAVAQKWFSLIDTGALITGFDNLGVARELMNRGLKENGIKGVVYLDDQDNKCVLMADGRERVPFATCGLKPGERFTFFDQVHCTGMDIPQVPNAIGVATLGKGMTLRDHAQACWRMRKFGQGQKIVLLAIPEVMKQVDRIQAGPEAERAATPGPEDQQGLLNRIMAWLLDGQIASEHTQREALAIQQLRDCWRQGAMTRMLQSKQPPAFQVGDTVKVVPDVDGLTDMFGNPRDADESDAIQLKVLSTERLEEDGTIRVHFPGDEEPKEVKVDANKVTMTDDSDNLRTRFLPQLTEPGADADAKRRLKGIKTRIKSQTGIVLAEDAGGQGQAAAAAAEDPTEALKALEAKFDEMMPLFVLCQGGLHPRATMERVKKETTELLTKPGFNCQNYMVNVYGYVQGFNDKPIVSERKKMLNEWCRLNLLGQSGNNNWLYPPDEKPAEQTAEAKPPGDDGKEEAPPDAGEKQGEDAEGEPEEPKALELLKSTPDSPHVRLRASVEVFCEEMSALQVSTETKLVARTLDKQMKELTAEHQPLISEDMEKVVVELLEQAKPKTNAAGKDGDGGLDSEMCQEQEQEQEEEKTDTMEKDIDDRKFVEMPEVKQWSVSDLKTEIRRKDVLNTMFYPLKDLQPQGGKDVPSLKIETDLMLSSNFCEKKLSKSAEDGVMKRRLPNASLLLYLKHGSRGVFVILNVAEAESLRAWMLTVSDDSAMGLLTSNGTWLTNQVTEKDLIIKPEVKDPLREGAIPMSAAAPLVFTRFFNWEVHYNELDMVSLVNILSPNKVADRLKWLQAIRDGRRRDRKDVKHTVVEQAISTINAKALETVRKGMQVVRRNIRDRFDADTDRAFAELDKSNDGSIDRVEFLEAFSQAPVEKAELNRLFDHFDASKDGLLDVREFLRALGIEETSLQDRVRQLMTGKSSVKAGVEKKRSTSAASQTAPTSIEKQGHVVVTKKAQRGLATLATRGGDDDVEPGELQVVCGYSACFNGSRVISCAVGGVATVAPVGLTLKLKDSPPVFFEMVVMEAPAGSTCSVGIATSRFAEQEHVQCVGDDEFSWGVCGFGRMPTTLHAKQTKIFEGPAWSSGTVLGMLIDLPRRSLKFFANGEELKGEFKNLDLGDAEYVVPVFTVEFGAKLYVNWGDQKLLCRPESLDSHVLTVRQLMNLQTDADLREREGIEKLGQIVKADVEERYAFLKTKWTVDATADEALSFKVEGYVFDTKAFFLNGMLLTKGRWYYEVELVDCQRYFKLSAGFGDARCEGKPENQYSGFNVGQAASWGLDVSDVTLCGDGELGIPFADKQYTDYSAQKGDIFGFEVNIEEASITMHYYGAAAKEERPNMGLAFVKIPFIGGLRPIISIGRGVSHVKLLLRPPRDRIPEGAKPVADYIESARMLLERHPADKLVLRKLFPDGPQVGQGVPDDHLRVSAGQAFAYVEEGELPLEVPVEPEAAAEDDSAAPAGATEETAPAAASNDRGSGDVQEVGASRRNSVSSVVPATISIKGFILRALKHRPVVRGVRPIFGGNYYYEVKVRYIYSRTVNDIAMVTYGYYPDEEEMRKKGGPASIGWSIPTFAGDHLVKGVGDDRFSWGYEGCNPKRNAWLKFNGQRFGQQLEKPAPKWEERCVIGVACMVNEGSSTAQMQWTCNGVLVNEEPEEVDLSVYSVPGLVPAISMHDGFEGEVNLGPHFWCAAKAAGNLVTPWKDCPHAFKPVRSVQVEDGVATGQRLRTISSSASLAFDDEAQDSATGPGAKEISDHTQLPTLRPTLQDMESWKLPAEAVVIDTTEEWSTSDASRAIAKWIDGKKEALAAGCTLNLSGLLQSQHTIAPLKKLLTLLLERKPKAQVYSLDLGRNVLLGSDKKCQETILGVVAKFVADPGIPLSRLVLSQCQLQSEDALSGSSGLGLLLATLPVGPLVKELDLSDNDLAMAVGDVSDKRRPQDKTIQDQLLSVGTLSLQNNGIGVEQLRALLPALKPNVNATTIKLGYNILDDTGAVLLATELGYNRQLRELHLPNANLTSKGVCALTDCFTPSHKLTHLNLSFNAVGMLGASAIANLMNSYPQLSSLDVTSAEIPSEGLVLILRALMTVPIEALKIGDNELDDTSGAEVALFLNFNRSLHELGLGSRSMFTPNFEAYELLSQCKAPLRDLVFRGQSLKNIEDQCKFIFIGCKNCMDLSSLDVGLIKILKGPDSRRQVGELFDRPLTFLLTDGKHGNTRTEMAKNYLLNVQARTKVIDFLIKQRNEPQRSAENGKRPRPFVDTRDAMSAVHGIVKICDADKEWPDTLRQWRKRIVEMMLGTDSRAGFGESRLVQLPICNAVLAAAKDDQPVLVHNASVREPVDAWQVKAKEDGKTVLQDAIEMECVDIACLIVRRNSAVTCTFKQEKEDVTVLYSALLSADNEIRFDVSPDYIGIDMPSDLSDLAPVRAAAARGMWSVVRALRQAGCADSDRDGLCGPRYKGRTVWHDLATPEKSNARGHHEQMLWADTLVKEECRFLAKVVDEDLRLPLHWAAQHDHHRLAGLLVRLYHELGAEGLTKKRDCRRFTPLELAVFHGHTKTVEVLLKAAEEFNDQKNLSITKSFEDKDEVVDPNADFDDQVQHHATGFFRNVAWLFSNAPRDSHLVWPCSPYHMVLLQMHMVSNGLESYRAEGSSSRGARRKGKRKLAKKKQPAAVSTEMMSLLNDTKHGDGARSKFLIRHLTKRVSSFMFWTLIFFLMSQSVFVGGFLSSTRMSIELQKDETSWLYNSQLIDNVMGDEFPWSEDDAFAKTFNDMTKRDDVWTFVEGVLYESLFPGLDAPGQVGPYAYLIGSPVMQMQPFIEGDCGGPLMDTPEMFAGIERLPQSNVSCVVGLGDYGSDVKLPRNNADAALQAIQGIDKGAWEKSAGVKISYAIYNTQLQRVLVSDLQVQFRPSGRVIPIPYTRVFLWMPINDISSWLYPFILCVLFVGYSLFNVAAEIKQMISEGEAYWRSRAEMFDVLREFIHVVIVGLLVTVTVQQAMLANKITPDSEEIYTTSGADVDLLTIAYFSIHLQKVFGFTFLLQTFNSIKLLRLFPGLGPQMQAIGQTLVDWKVTQFLGFLVVFVVGCALTVRTIFGADQVAFATLPDAFFGMYRFIWGDWDFTDNFQADKLWGPAGVYGYMVFIAVTFVVTGTLANVFIAIVGDRYNIHLSKSEEDWVQEVNGIMASWYGDSFLGKNPGDGMSQMAKTVREWDEPVEDGDDGQEPVEEGGGASAASRELASSVQQVQARMDEHQQQMQAIDSNLKEMKELLKTALAGNSGPETQPQPPQPPQALTASL